MKNKNTILIEIAIQSAGRVFSGLYWGRSTPLESIPYLIEEECDRQITSVFKSEDKISERDVHMCKMYAVQYYNEYMSRIMTHRMNQIESEQDA
jgi:hypothetical protein